MLNRRHLRIKVLQMLYAFFNDTESNDVKQAEEKLLSSVNRIYDLYAYLLLSFPLLKKIAENKQDERKNKLRPSKDDLYPNLKFVENRLITLIQN